MLVYLIIKVLYPMMKLFYNIINVFKYKILNNKYLI